MAPPARLPVAEPSRVVRLRADRGGHRSPLHDLGAWANAAGWACLIIAPLPFFWCPPAWVLWLMSTRPTETR
jgi:hypothetical protein